MGKLPYRRYQLRVIGKSGVIILGYVEGVLHTFTSTIIMPAGWITKMITKAVTESYAEELCNGINDNIEAEAIPVDLSFDNFWSLWPGVKGNKKRALGLWDKLTEEDKVSCLWSLIRYKQYISKNSSWYNPMWPDGYIRSQRYMDDWK